MFKKKKNKVIRNHSKNTSIRVHCESNKIINAGSADQMGQLTEGAF